MRRPCGTRSSPRSTRSIASCGASRSSVSSTGCRPISSTRRPTRAARPGEHAIDLQKEADLAASWDSTPSSSTRAPFINQPAVRFDNQAKFHPRKYLVALLRLLCAGKGCQVFEQTEHRRDRGHADHRDDVERRAHSLRARAHRDARAAAGQVGAAARDGASIEARALQLVRRRRMGAARHRSRSALLGYGRSVRLPARRSPARSRLRHLRRRRSQDRAGGRHDGMLQPARAAAQVAAAGDRAHASVVGAGHRNERRPALHRRDGRAAVRRDRICRATA